MEPTNEGPAKPRTGVNPFMAAAIIAVTAAGLGVMGWKAWQAPMEDAKQVEREAAAERAAVYAKAQTQVAAATRRSFVAPPPAGSPATRPAPPLPQQVADNVAGLAAASADDRETAEDWLRNAPPDALPLIEAAVAGGDAPAAARRTLAGILPDLRRLAGVRAKRAAAARAEAEWNLRTAVDAYDRFSRTNVAWDDAAHEALGMYLAADEREWGEAAGALERLVTTMRCDDPLVLALAAQALDGWRGRSRQQDLLPTLYARSCEGLEQSGYPAYRKCMAMARRVTYDRRSDAAAVRQRGRRRTGVPDEHRWADVAEWHADWARRRVPTPAEQRWADAALALWPAACAETPATPARLLAELGEAVADAQAACGADRAAVLDEKILPPFETAHPNGPAALVLRGRQYIRYAWEARGYWVEEDDIPPDRLEHFKARLDKAAGFLQRAYDLEPVDPDAATAMVHAQLGRKQGRAEMEKWFARAVAADPDRRDALYPDGYDAYDWKLEYLQPHWHGMQTDPVVFGRECAATRNWRGGVAQILLDVHQSTRDRLPTQNAYFARSDVWAEVESVVLPPVRMAPWDVAARTRYAYYANRSDRFETADEQFQLLGDRADPAALGPGADGRQNLDLARSESAAMVGRPSTFQVGTRTTRPAAGAGQGNRNGGS